MNESVIFSAIFQISLQDFYNPYKAGVISVATLSSY